MRLATIFCALGAVSAAVLKEPRTGIGFQEKRGGGSLGALGVRTKGPIKVYAVGEYDNGDYVLKMSYGVSAAKMVSALGDALKPRCGDAKMIEKFEECLLAGLPDGAPKGTQMAFSTGGGSLKVAINDKSVGAISSKPLCEAFANIYKDKNAVCTMTPVGADGEVWVSFSNRAAPGPKPKPKPKPNQVSAAANLGLAYALKGAMLGAAAGFGYSKVAA